jgi:hypothetical protein
LKTGFDSYCETVVNIERAFGGSRRDLLWDTACRTAMFPTAPSDPSPDEPRERLEID